MCDQSRVTMFTIAEDREAPRIQVHSRKPGRAVVGAANGSLVEALRGRAPSNLLLF
jgi:hypothetical protein